MDWWHRDVIEPGKLPLLLCFAAFVLTFLTTRSITRMIRAGRGPFRDNVTAGGTHVHHAIPGIVLLITGAFVSVGAEAESVWAVAAAIAIGIGTSLVLDEFALILHLQDVYWSDEGRVSVEMVSLAAGCLGFTLIGFAPFGVNGMGSAELTVRIGVVATTAIGIACVGACVLKGKFRFALFGIFVPPLAWVGAVRLARPGSRWAKARYSDERAEHALHRATAFDARWDPVLDRLSDLVAGKPTDEEGAAVAAPTPRPGSRPERAGPPS